MESFVLTPNCPQARVTLAAAGNYPHITKALINEGIRVISFYNPGLSEEVSRHSDMLICHTGGNALFIDPLQEKDLLISEGFDITECHPLGKEYPLDVGLNIAVSRDFFIYNPKSADVSLQKALISSDKIPFTVKQGYTKCSVCFVTDNAIITEDMSIEAALRGTDTDVLTISKGDIFLSPEHYGFFGGSSGKISRDTLAVTGELKYHRDADRIISFCNRHNVKIKELSKGVITDIGGILPLKEMRL